MPHWLCLKMDEDEAILLRGISAAYLVPKGVNKRKKSRRSVWMKKYFKTRNFRILKDLQGNDNVFFRNFTRMSNKNFETLLGMVKPQIEKSDSCFREAIPAEVKLAIALRFLASGDSFASLMYLFRVSKQSTRYWLLSSSDSPVVSSRVSLSDLSAQDESFVCFGVTESAMNSGRQANHVES